MSKAEAFKKWCAERQNHPPQIKAALEAILELEELNQKLFDKGVDIGVKQAKSELKK